MIYFGLYCPRHYCVNALFVAGLSATRQKQRPLGRKNTCIYCKIITVLGHCYCYLYKNKHSHKARDTVLLVTIADAVSARCCYISLPGAATAIPDAALFCTCSLNVIYRGVIYRVHSTCITDTCILVRTPVRNDTNRQEFFLWACCCVYSFNG